MPHPVMSAGVNTEWVTENKNDWKCKVHWYRKESVEMWTNPAGLWKENWEMGMAMQNWKCLKNYLKKILLHRNWEWPPCFCCQTSNEEHRYVSQNCIMQRETQAILHPKLYSIPSYSPSQEWTKPAISSMITAGSVHSQYWTVIWKHLWSQKKKKDMKVGIYTPKLSTLNLISHHSSVRWGIFCEWGVLGETSCTSWGGAIQEQGTEPGTSVVGRDRPRGKQPWAVLREEPIRKDKVPPFLKDQHFKLFYLIPFINEVGES